MRYHAIAKHVCRRAYNPGRSVLNRAEAISSVSNSNVVSRRVASTASDPPGVDVADISTDTDQDIEFKAEPLDEDEYIERRHYLEDEVQQSLVEHYMRTSIQYRSTDNFRREIERDIQPMLGLFRKYDIPTNSIEQKATTLSATMRDMCNKIKASQEHCSDMIFEGLPEWPRDPLQRDRERYEKMSIEKLRTEERETASDVKHMEANLKNKIAAFFRDLEELAPGVREREQKKMLDGDTSLVEENVLVSDELDHDVYGELEESLPMPKVSKGQTATPVSIVQERWKAKADQAATPKAQSTPGGLPTFATKTSHEPRALTLAEQLQQVKKAQK